MLHQKQSFIARPSQLNLIGLSTKIGRAGTHASISQFIGSDDHGPTSLEFNRTAESRLSVQRHWR
jgi:hypothetical protein